MVSIIRIMNYDKFLDLLGGLGFSFFGLLRIGIKFLLLIMIRIEFFLLIRIRIDLLFNSL